MTIDVWALYTQIINLNGSCVWEIYENESGWGNSTPEWMVLQNGKTCTNICHYTIYVHVISSLS